MTKKHPEPNDNSEKRTTNEIGTPPVVLCPQKKIHIPQVDELLEKLMHLNLAVLTGKINVGTANFIHRNLKDILDVQIKRASHTDSGQSAEALIDLCRRDPSAISAVEGFLTIEQLQTLMAEISDDSHDPA
jgi:hypothetical protein